MAEKEVGLSGWQFGSKYNPHKWVRPDAKIAGQLKDYRKGLWHQELRKNPTLKRQEIKGKAHYLPGKHKVEVPPLNNPQYTDWILPAIDLHEYGHAESAKEPGSAQKDYRKAWASKLHEESYASRKARDKSPQEMQPTYHEFLEDALGTYARHGQEAKEKGKYGGPLKYSNQKRGEYNPEKQLQPTWFDDPARYKEWVGPRDEVATDYADYWFTNPDKKGRTFHPADAGKDVQAVDIYHRLPKDEGKLYRMMGSKDSPAPTVFPVSKPKRDTVWAQPTLTLKDARRK